MGSTQPLQPTVAVSYSWTTEEHSEWVEELSTRLRNDGVDVKLDVWDLGPGQDKFHFMESFVNDPTITKVLIICDEGYQQKANRRTGGVGVETQIISPEVYEEVDQTKFIPIVAERDENGEPYLPTYLKGRMYIDLSQLETYQEQYATLLVNIFGQPLRAKPPLGKPPSYIVDKDATRLATTARFEMFMNALLRDRRTVGGLAKDYLDALSEQFDGPDFKPSEFMRGTQMSDAYDIARSTVQKFLPYTGEFVEFVFNALRYDRSQEITRALYEFFDSNVRFVKVDDVRDVRVDHLRFIIGELFLYTLALLIKDARFSDANILLSQIYLDPALRAKYPHTPSESTSFAVFSLYMHSATYGGSNWAVREEMNKLLRSRDSAVAHRLSMEDIADAEGVLYIRSLEVSQVHARWMMVSPHFRHGVGTLRIFRKASSKDYFEQLKIALNVRSKDDLVDRLEGLSSNRKLGELPSVAFSDVLEEHFKLLGMDGLATR